MIKVKEFAMVNAALFMAGVVLISTVYVVPRSVIWPRGQEMVFEGSAVTSITKVKASPIARSLAQPIAKAATAPAPIVPALPIVPPAITFKVLPAYPASALANGLAGTVVLSVYVGLNGQPEKIETRLSSGVSELDSSAAAAVSQWRFSPALQSGQALASWFEVPVRFEVK